MLTPVILIADPQNLFVEGLSRIVREKVMPVDIVTATNIDELKTLFKQTIPQVIFLNYYFIARHFHDIRPVLAKQGYPEIIAICDEWTEDARKQAASLGALNILSKNCSSEAIWQELERISNSGTPLAHQTESPSGLVTTKTDALTARQRKILQLLACGLTNREISNRIGCAETTVKAHLNIAYKVLGVKNRTQAMYVISQIAPLSESA